MFDWDSRLGNFGLFLFAGSTCLGFYLVEIMINDQDHKLSSAWALYLAVVRLILAIFFFAIATTFCLQVVFELTDRQRLMILPQL